MAIAALNEFLAVNWDATTNVTWLAYIIIGGFAGWIASKIMKTDAQQGILLNIVVGVVGAFGAGLILLNVFDRDVNSYGWLFTFFIAVVGAVVLLWLVKLLRK